MDALVTFPVGALAGLALAAPLGAIGVLLMQEGLERGLRGGLPAATAVATVDTLYCAIAAVAGTLAAPAIAGLAPWPQLGGGVVLIAIGIRALVRSLRATGAAPGRPRTATASTRGRYPLFLALTAINPATLLYFVAILPGLAQVAGSATSRVAFVAGVATASFAWQALLVVVGAALRRTTGPRFRFWTALVGNGVVVLFGILLIARAL